MTPQEIYARTSPVMLPSSGKLRYQKGGEVAEGLTREELIKKLTELREANGVELGDPTRDIDQYLATVKGYSAPISADRTATAQQGKPTFIQRVNSWLMNAYSQFSSIRYVNSIEANRRAEICVACPMNKEWVRCTTCSKSAIQLMERNVAALSLNKKTNFHDQLKGCFVTGQANRVGIWLSEGNLKGRVNSLDKLPAKCWLKDLP